MNARPHPTEMDTTLRDLLDIASQRLTGEIRLMTIEEQLADLIARVEQLERAHGLD